MSANEIPLCKVTVAKEKNILIGDQLQMLLQFCKCRCWTFASKVGPYRLHTSYVKIHTSDVFIILCYLLRSHCGIWFRIVLLYCIAYWKDCTSVSPQLEQASLKKSCACTPLGQHMSMFLVSDAFLISVFLCCWPLWVVVVICFQENCLLCFLQLTNCCYSVITVPPSMEDTRRKLLF